MNFKKLIPGIILALSLSLPYTVTAETDNTVPDDTPVYADDFELETINGWSVLGGVGTMSIDTSRKHSGNSSLNITGRANTFNGPSISLDKIFESEETYRIEGWVYHESSKKETINCTLRYADSVNVNTYEGIAVIEAPPSSWVHFEGTVETPEDLTSTLLYFESPDASLDYNIDDIAIYGKAPENAVSEDKKGSDIVSSYKFDFESGFGDWIQRGDTRIIRSNEQQCTGDYSILSTNREKSWNGPTVSIDGVERGVEYTYEANVLYTEKKADDSHLFMLQVQYSYNGNEVYDLIGSAEVQKNVWTKIKGTLVIPEGAANVMLYVQTDNVEDGVTPTLTDLVSFYIDDVSAVRSDLINPKKNIVYILIFAGIIAALIILIVIIAKSLSQSSDETNEEEKEELDSVSKVINSLENNKPVLPANSGTKTVNNTADTKNENKPAEAKKEQEDNSAKPSDNSKEKQNKSVSGNSSSSSSKKSGKEKNKNSSSGKPAQTENNKSEKSVSGDKNKKSGSSSENVKKDSDNSVKQSENKKTDTKEKAKSEPAESKSAGSKDSSSENKEKVSVTEKSSTTEKSAEKPEKSESPVSDDSRARDIFNIETFSYDEGNTQYDENSDDPLENPFEGF
ncbi:MAG: carbohydrate binding domain-containing protein [Oscillospiraceae bacterium]|nr:carbohydrate binding domain-containing protein [Oscillospiraceae bacterium]